MDPGGPWSAAYASYNRLAGVQAGTSGDIHPQLTQGVTPPTTTAPILPGGFISPTAVSYESVFSPLFHPAGTKPPVHYVAQVAQHRQPLTQAQTGTPSSKQPSEGEYQGQVYFEQSGAWQQNSPFGVLPHESIVPSTTASKSTGYENFNAHFATAQSHNQMNPQLVASNPKGAVPRVQATQAAKSTAQPNPTAFYPVPATFPNTEPPNNTKTFVTTDTSNLQSCIVSSPSNIASKDYRLPQSTNRTTFHASPARTSEKSYTALPEKQTLPQIQTKAQTKIYPDLNNQVERQRSSHHDENQTHSSPVTFATDVPGLNYTNNNAKRAHYQSSNYRHYQPGNNTEGEFQLTKTGIEYNNSNGSDCSGISRRESPLQTQASPLGHAQSPAYPMYNSPMNSVASPQQASTNHVTPSSPLDATVTRPNSQSGNVAYPSVITHALNSADRSVQQECWDERQRKFQNHSTVQTNYNMELPSRIGEQCQPRNANTQERQQAFFNTSSPHQVPLQDRMSCRGDPISLVKNVQPQVCQIQQLDVKAESKVSNKRRKSNDKLQHVASEIPQGPVMPEYFTGRIPPPAHSSASSQQQNGAYFDFDRWNLPPPSSKMFGTQPIHPQHQGIMVSHPHSHHPPPSLPYFPPFHLPAHPEYPPTVELTPSAYNEQSNQNSMTQLSEDNDKPKVVVPNIEEELEFLSGTNTRPTTTTSQSMPVMRAPPIVNQVNSSDKTSGTAGFMNSYLKFLQGERDSSPPPARTVRKQQSWSKSRPVQPIVAQTNGVTPIPPTAVPASRLSQGDPQDDPRYFPLPKERKKNRFDSSDDGLSSEDDLFTQKIPSKRDFLKDKTFKRRKAVKPAGRRPPPKKVTKPKREKDLDESTVFNLAATVPHTDPPRRESSKRAAKEKCNMRQMIEDDMDHLDYIDSDSDPAWSPKRYDEEEVVPVMRKGKKIRFSQKRRPRNLITAAAQCAGINDLDGYISDGMGNKKPKILGIMSNQEQKQIVPPALENNIAAAIVNQTTVPSDPMDNPFKHGDFLVAKLDLSQEWPPLWRVDGKALLQRYEPFEQNGQTLYKNVQTYTAWTPDSIKQYTVAPVNYKVETPSEVIVEFLRKDMVSGFDLSIVEKAMDTSKMYQDNFEVYIQTLISQALDSNFLTEIFQEQDDYFLTNVKTIDDITDNQKYKMINFLQWPKAVLVSVNTWPCFNVINESTASNSHIRPCAGCLRPGISMRVLMFGQPYNTTTLESCQPNVYNVEKDFLMCRMCASRVELFNKITHQKYLMYIQCAKKVAEKRSADPNKDTTCILNELLADEPWLNRLFNDVRCSWAEVDRLECRYKLNNQCGDSSNNKTVL